MKVKALYHFLDKKASRNRKQGDIFDVPEERAVELEKDGLVGILEPKTKANPPENPAESDKADAQEKPKKQKK